MAPHDQPDYSRGLISLSKQLTLVTKVGARRDDKGAWLPAFTKAEITQAVHDNLINVGLE